jgi:hypothetical protein|tara:strand:+ start:34 stop:279 length:246 start_codon:yes stop_codon:yes gene_type:complete
MAYRVVKQLSPAPTSSVDRDGNSFDDPWWVERNNIWVSKLSGSSDALWQYSGSDAQANATTKMNALTGSDDTGRLYKVVEV